MEIVELYLRIHCSARAAALGDLEIKKFVLRIAAVTTSNEPITKRSVAFDFFTFPFFYRTRNGAGGGVGHITVSFVKSNGCFRDATELGDPIKEWR